MRPRSIFFSVIGSDDECNTFSLQNMTDKTQHSALSSFLPLLEALSSNTPEWLKLFHASYIRRFAIARPELVSLGVILKTQFLACRLQADAVG